MKANASFFKINPAQSTRLAEQLADKIRKALRKGLYRPGDTLPSYHELARLAGTSLRIPREAISILVGEGLVAACRGRGTIVLKRKHNSIDNGRILLVHPNGHGAYYLGALMEETDRLLTDAGYIVTRVAMRKNSNGKYDFNLLKHLLSHANFTSGLVFAYDDQTIEPIAKSGLPYVICTFRPIKYSGAHGRINYSHRLAIPELIRHCHKAKIKRILQVVTVPWLLDVHDDLTNAGFEVENIRKRYPIADIGKQEQVERSTFELLCKWLKEKPLPDLIVFTDDFATRGGILALTERGIRYPKDVKLVAWSNRHFGPVAPVSLTRMSMDPFDHAKTIANSFLAFLRTGSLPKNVTIGPAYIKGDSFP